MSPPRTFRRVTVFAASSFGHDPVYRDAARELGTQLVREGIAVVYGGASVGLMTAVADAALAAGGEVIGIIPRFLADHEIAHQGLTELHVVDSMAERKALMDELSDGFVALPGGLGTLEELFEMTVHAQLHLHDKPVGLLDVAGYYAHLRAFVQHMVDEGLVKAATADLLLFDDDPACLLERMRNFVASPTDKWIDR